MKTSTKRFIFGIWALFPALSLCLVLGDYFGIGGLLSNILHHPNDILGDILCGSFISCIIIYIIYMKDTLQLYKEEK